MKKFISYLFCTTLVFTSCSDAFDAEETNLAEKMHAESCDITAVEPTTTDGKDQLEIVLHNVDTAYFGHPEWILHSYAAQEFYNSALPLLVNYEAVKIKLENAEGNAAFWMYPIWELEMADSLYLICEQIVSSQGTGMGSMMNYRDLFDPIMPVEAFPQIDQTIAESEAKNGPQQSICFGGYRRVILEYMDTPVFQIVVQQKRSANTDCYVFSFSETTGQIMTLQLNGSLE